jgi:hypothetical protein
MPVSPLQYLLCNFLTDILAVAFKLTDDKIPADIEFGYCPDDRKITFYVKDDGSGILPLMKGEKNRYVLELIRSDIACINSL